MRFYGEGLERKYYYTVSVMQDFVGKIFFNVYIERKYLGVGSIIPGKTSDNL